MNKEEIVSVYMKSNKHYVGAVIPPYFFGYRLLILKKNKIDSFLFKYEIIDFCRYKCKVL